jgi:hypothetical protein
VNFWSDFDKVIDSQEHLMAMGSHNIKEFAKIEAMDEECQERIRNIVSNILASVLQKEAIEKYSNTDCSSIRQVLYSWFSRPEDCTFWDRLRHTAKLTLLGLNLTEEQSDAVMKGMFDKLPQAIMEVIEELTSPLRLLPRAEARSIATALSDVMKGERYANGKQYN